MAIINKRRAELLGNLGGLAAAHLRIPSKCRSNFDSNESGLQGLATEKDKNMPVRRKRASVFRVVAWGLLFLLLGLLGSNLDFQFTFFVFFCLILLVWRGAGPLSLDHLVNSEAEKELAPST